jgi:hypothetical protein
MFDGLLPKLQNLNYYSNGQLPMLDKFLGFPILNFFFFIQVNFPMFHEIFNFPSLINFKVSGPSQIIFSFNKFPTDDENFNFPWHDQFFSFPHLELFFIHQTCNFCPCLRELPSCKFWGKTKFLLKM